MNRPPNVLVFFTDQQRWDTCGIHGNPLDLTPNFDDLARRGTHARYAFTCQPVCGPARSCVQTGRYATETGCYRNGIPLPPTERTLAHHFSAAGYSTGYIGKWHLGSRESRGPVAPQERGGYDYWLGANAVEMVSDSYDCRLFDQNDQEVRLPGYRVDGVTDAAIRHLQDRSREDNPFLLFLSFLEPHHQNHRDDYPAPDLYEARYNGRWQPADLASLGGTSVDHLGGYCGMVKRLDEALGRVRDALKSMGQLDNTIIVFTSDHGCHFKTRNREYKRTCHEASIRIPLAFSGPGFDGGGELQNMISLVDLAPTLLDAAGLPLPANIQGRSILPLVRGESTDWPAEAFVQTSEHEVGRSIRTSRWKYGVLAPSLDGNTVDSSEVYEEAFLYDLDNDPAELDNLILDPQHREVAEALASRLQSRIIEAGESPARIVPAEKSTIDALSNFTERAQSSS